MKVLVTGHAGYIGSVMVEVLQRAGHAVTGLDTYFYEGCDFGAPAPVVPSIRKDIRDVVPADLAGFDAIVHLAALSNDPLGCLDESCTYDINHHGSVSLAKAAKAAGVARYLFASSCSLYGAAGDAMLDETAAFNPITAYGTSKVLVERDVAALADENFSPTFLRNATAFGVSPRLRADIVVNNLVGVAYTTGEILIQSDGTPWRPLVHVQDISRAFLAVLEAPRAAIHNQAFNVGGSGENYQIRDIASIVQEVVPGCTVRYQEGGGPDPRCYRVSCDKIAVHVPGFRTEWTVRRGVEELYTAFVKHGLTREMFAKYVRLPRIQSLLSSGQVDAALRRRATVDVA
ncbi:MAG TPA: SDR family oxidoreductase [Gemmatimonadales bacterium]|nr:SDR family oxidoreductase [Gemmatimonadales bacterium]